MRFAASAVLVIVYATSLAAAPTDYTFTNVVDATGVFTGSNPPAIDNAGKIAFNATLTSGITGIFTGPNPATDTFADNSSPNGYLDIGNPTISKLGILFPATLKGDELPALYAGPVFADFATHIGDYANIRNQTINDHGQFAFWGVTRDVPSVQGIFSGDLHNSSSSVTTIADNNHYPFLNDSAGPRITSSGQVAFIAGTNLKSGIFTGPDPSADVIVDSSGLIGGFRNFDINDHGGIIMSVQLDDETPALLTGLDPVKDQLSLDGFGFAGDVVAINNSGKFVFNGFTLDGHDGLFTGEDPVRDRILVLGDQLFGSTVTLLEFDTSGFNDQGQVAFAYELANGAAGIAIASPGGASAIPLPSALPAAAVVACAFAAHSTFRKWRASMPA